MGSNGFLKFRQKIQKAALREFGKNIYPLWGNQNAKIVSISQAPSLSVIKYQKPFFDKSGQRLRREWYKVSDEVFYNPDNFYFTAIGKAFPGKNKKGGDNKPDYNWANRWLKKELSFLSPKLFLVVGRVAAEFFFPKKDFTELVFADQELNGKPAIVLPHPSPVNIKWFKDHPDFEKKRLPVIRKYIHLSLK